jgi:hypothetical protein
VTFLPLRVTPDFLGILHRIGEVVEGVHLLRRSSSRLKMMKSCGSPRTGWSATSTIFSPEMSTNCSVLGVQRADRQEAVFRELAADRTATCRRPNIVSGLRGVDVARLEMHVETVDHVLARSCRRRGT